MAGSFDRDLLQILRDHGCYFVRSGRHDIWYSPLSDQHFPVPNGIKSRHTANQVLKQAGLPKMF